MPSTGISLDDIKAALSAEGHPWQAGVTNLISLPLEEQAKYLGVVPPPGEPSIEQVALQALQSQAQSKEMAMTCGGRTSVKGFAQRGLCYGNQEPGELRLVRCLRYRDNGREPVRHSTWRPEPRGRPERGPSILLPCARPWL